MDAASELARRAAAFEPLLRAAMNDRTVPAILGEAMSYSLFAVSKRVRPVLCLAMNELFGGDESDAVPLACGIEMIHSYSLVHDDLPCMDDDDTRRGKPSNHVVFGYPIALLAGDGLLNAAFETMISGYFSARKKGRYMRAMEEIARASGRFGMIAGQTADMTNDEKSDQEDLNYISQNKTGALIRASVLAGALVGGASGPQVSLVGQFGDDVGTMFQIVDDLIDLRDDPKRDEGKLTWPSVIGRENSVREVERLGESAKSKLACLGEGIDFLRDLVDYLMQRSS